MRKRVGRHRRAGALDRERSPARRMLVGDRTPARSRRCLRRPRLEDDARRSDLHDRKRVRVTVRVDTNDVVQLICKHPDRPPAHRWGTPPVPVWDETAGGRTVTGHAPKGRTGF